IAMHDQRAGALRALAPDPAEILPGGLAEEPVHMTAIRLVGSVRGRREERAFEDRERVAHVVRGRRRPSAVEPARLAAGVDPERDAELVARPVVAAGARDRAEIEARARDRIELRREAAGSARAVARNLCPQAD